MHVTMMPLAFAVTAAVLAMPGSAAQDDQALLGVPSGLTLETPAHYSFGAGAAPDGSIWYTEFNHQRIRRYDPTTGRVETRSAKRPGVYCIASDKDGNMFVSLDQGDVGNRSKVGRIDAQSGAESVIIRNLTRPRQVAADSAGNVYVVCEAATVFTNTPSVIRWNRQSASVTVFMKDLATPQGIAIAPNGTVYVSEYGTQGKLAGRVLARTPDGTVRTLASGFWQARGLALAPDGSLYLTTESNEGDQGNSGLLVRIDTAAGKHTTVLSGLDYPEFPCVGKDGRVYFACNRDSWLTAYDPRAAWSPARWPHAASAPAAVLGGDLDAASGGVAVKLEIGGQRRDLRIRPSQAKEGMCAWVRLSAEPFRLSRKELFTDRGDPEHCQPGLFEVPALRWKCESGSLMAAAVAVRAHDGKRWPMTNPGKPTEAPAQGFDESPTGYLVFMRWTPADVVDDRAKPAYRDAHMTILSGASPAWSHEGGSWSRDQQSFGQVGMSSADNDAWAELSLREFAGRRLYVYVMWHKIGQHRPSAVGFRLWDYASTFAEITANQQHHADDLELADDTFSGWRLVGTRRVLITPSTRLRVSRISPPPMRQYLHADAVLLSEVPVIGSTCSGAATDFPGIARLSVPSTGPTGIGHHWWSPGLSYQFTSAEGTSYSTALDPNVFSDAPDGAYRVEPSWVTPGADRSHVAAARYSVNGVLSPTAANQNLSADGQQKPFVKGNSWGTWSGFLPLAGTHSHARAKPLLVRLDYRGSYAGRRLIANMIRFIPVAPDWE